MTQSGHELRVRELFESVLVSDNCRLLVFQGPFLFNKRLVNHTIGYKIGVNFEDCEMHCYFENKCVSVNYQVDTETCELNNAKVDSARSGTLLLPGRVFTPYLIEPVSVEPIGPFFFLSLSSLSLHL